MASAVAGAEQLCPVCEEPLTVDLAAAEAKEKEEEDAQKNGDSPGKAAQLPAAPKIRKQSILSKIDLANFQPSTKMEALMQELHAMERRDPAAKAIVFSQFVSMLDLLEHRVKLGGFRCRQLSGHMNIAQRDQALKAFRGDPECKVLLISLKAGGVALNLTVANHIFLMDPWWNPAGEMQAIDRTHRIGQAKPIRAVRFVIEDTVEERILRLQDKKRLVFDGTVGGDQASLARLTVDDLRFLFSN
uniref:Helicase C-terminal domain-containing protein n=1 Tax=Heterosigma akashiwo TaxID=2829 RepID=A0A6V1NWH0_HETAK